MPKNLYGVILFLLLIFPLGLLMHIIFVDASIFLSLIGDTFGKVLAFCGINGIVVSEKPSYMWGVYLLYMSIVTAVGFWLTILLKNLIESIFSGNQGNNPG